MHKIQYFSSLQGPLRGLLRLLGVFFLLVSAFCVYNVLIVWRLEHTLLTAGIIYGTLNALLACGFLLRQSWLYVGLLINFLAIAGLIGIEILMHKNSMDTVHIVLAVGIAGALALVAYASLPLLKKNHAEKLVGGAFIFLRLGVLCYTVATTFL